MKVLKLAFVPDEGALASSPRAFHPGNEALLAMQKTSIARLKVLDVL